MANLSKIIGDIATSSKLEKFFSSLKHSDLPTGWQNDPQIVDAAGKLYREMGTESPFFKAWNQGSIVRHPATKDVPTSVYHGTPNSGFDFFDPYGGNVGLWGDGLYFTESPNIASQYAQRKNGNNGVIQGYLNLKNPMQMESRDTHSSVWKNAFPDGAEYFTPGASNGEHFNSAMDYLRDTGFPAIDSGEMVQDAIKSMGFDGITHLGGGRHAASDGERHKVWIAFNPQQFKSKFNSGTFSPEDWSFLKGIGPIAVGTGVAGSLLGSNDAQAATYPHANASNLDRTIERLSKALPLNDMASGIIPRATQASMQPINNMDVWRQMEQQGRVTQDLPVPEAEWSPVDLATAPIGAAGKVGKLAAMALDAPATLAVNRIIDALSTGANTASNWWNGK